MNMKTKKKGAFLFLVMFLFPLFQEVNFAKSRDFTVEQVLSYPFPSSLRASSKGQKIAWVFNRQGVYNIWLAEGPEFQARQLTDFKKDDGRGLTIRGFIKNDNILIFSKNERFNPDHAPHWDGKSLLYQLDCRDGKIEKLAENGWAAVSSETNQLAYTKEGSLYIFSPGEEPKKRLSTRGNLARLEWSPNGKQLVMQSQRGEFPHRYSYIMIYDIEKDKVKYIDASVYFDDQPTWSPGGQKIAFMRRLTHGHRGLITARKFPVPDPWIW